MNNSGFTLLETLVAGFILFMVVSSATLIFRSSITSISTAEEYVKATTFAPILADHIRTEITTNKNKGDGVLLGVEYSWSASIQSRAALKTDLPSVLDDSNDLQSRPVLLYLVRLEMVENERTFNYQFNVTAMESG